ncbi:MAG: hypothetical protein RLY16_3075 [Bacteroidota bacterium]
MRFIFSFVLLLDILPLIAQVPTIQSTQPVTAKVGDVITIQGNNFGNNASNISVQFGSVQASLQSVSNTAIQAVVPAGSLYQSIAIKRDSLSAQSPLPFITGFSNGIGPAFESNAFGSPVGLAAAVAPCWADWDGDGLLDAAAVFGTIQLAVFRNTGSMAIPQITQFLLLSPGYKAMQIAAADMDADGKSDLVVIYNNNRGIYVYRNTSTQGSISFDAPFTYSVGTDYPFQLAIADIDGNGKPDIAVSYASASNAFSVVRNLSTSGNFVFATKTNISFGSGVGTNNKIYAGDLDKDGKVDITVLSSYFRPIYSFRNTSVVGSVSFAPKISITSGRGTAITNEFYDLQLGDIDNDQKLDILFTHSDTDSVVVFRNLSTSGSLSFSERIGFKTRVTPIALAINDLDGDGDVDVAVLSAYDSVCVHPNLSTAGNVYLESYKGYYAGYPLQTIQCADIDFDGKADMIFSGTDVNNNNRNALVVLRNQVYGPVINSLTPNTAATGTVITLSGKRLLDVTQVYLGGVASNFSIIDDSTILVTVVTGATGTVFVQTTYGVATYNGFNFSAPIPRIDSFLPSSGELGSLVTLYGRNFSSTAENNRVYFGSGKAAVVGVTDSTLQVLVPSGSSYEPIRLTLLDNHLSAWSRLPFVIRQPNSVSAFSAGQFSDSVNYITFGNPTQLGVADLNGDQKTDVFAGIYFNTNRISIFKNASALGTVLMHPRLDYLTFYGSIAGGTASTVGVATADFDNDGWSDIAAINAYPDSISIFRNKSTLEQIEFATKVDIIGGTDPEYLAVLDIDLDGKPDLFCNNSSVSKVSVIRNTSVPGTISFQPRIELVTASGVKDVLMMDFDGDLYPDLASVQYNASNLVVFKNISTPGTISFAAKQSFTTGTGPWYLAAADLNNDGKPEVITINIAAKTLSIFENQSTIGNIAFAPKLDYALPTNPGGITVSDLDGDGWVDIIVTNTAAPNSISLLKNTSSSTVISFAPKVDIAKVTSPNNIFAADMDGDGMQDLITTNETKKVSILLNKMGKPVTSNMCRSIDSTSFQSNLIGQSYQWQIDSGNGFENLIETTQFIGVNNRTVLLRNIPSSWYGYRLRCITDGVASQLYKLVFVKQWLGTVSNEWENPLNWGCGGLPDAYTDVVIKTGNVIVNSNVRVGSILVRLPAKLTVNPDFNITTTR